MTYAIYKITSPGGRSYIGLTKSSLKDRWRQHVKRAFSFLENKPFYNAIRKYGPDAFSLEVLEMVPTKESAQAAERKHIAGHGLPNLYNISPGGEADGETGSKVFWDRMRSDPAAKAEYLESLSRAKTLSDWSDYKAMGAKAKAWRKENPREAYRLAYRGIRLARKARTPVVEAPLPLKEKLFRKHRIEEVRRRNTTAVWKSRSEEEKASISEKISRSVKNLWGGISDKGVRSQKTAQARAAIDRSKQAPAASKGLKKFWEEIKKDPDRYATYLANRNATRAARKKEKVSKYA